MKQEVLQYSGYKNFRCIADKCKHTCWLGWQINIDDESYKKYKMSIYFNKTMNEKFIKKKII